MGLFSNAADQKAMRLLEKELGGDVEIFGQTSCEFRVAMTGGRPSHPSWDKWGYVAASSQGLHVWKPKGGLFSQDWATIQYLNPHIGTPGARLSAISFDGNVTQAFMPNGANLLGQAFTAWTSQQPSSIDAGGAEVDFLPGGFEKLAVMGVEGAWGGGKPQARRQVDSWASKIRSTVSLDGFTGTIAIDLPEPHTPEFVWKWMDERVRRVVQSELQVTNRVMKEIDVVMTRGALLSNEHEKLFNAWLAIINGTELWVMYFPFFEDSFQDPWWPSLGMDHRALPDPRQPGTWVGTSASDLMPSTMLRYDLTKLEGDIRTSVYDNDGCFPLSIRTPHQSGGLISSSFDVPPVMALGIDGEYGWEVFRTVLNAATHGGEE